jgi:hypothetical protein
MATVKNTSGDYVINCANDTGNLSIDANLNINHPYFKVAADNNGVINAMGMIAQVTLTDWAGLRYNSQAGQWEASTSVNEDGTPITPYLPIGSSSGGSPAPPFRSLQFNDSGTFGGSNDFTFDSNLAELTLAGYQVYANIGFIPAPIANAVSIVGNEPALGNTGLYVTTPDSVGELISAQQALIYSLIF